VVNLLAGLAATALLVACGGGSSEDRVTEPTGRALTHAQYQQAIWDLRGSDATDRATRLFFAVVGELDTEECSTKTHALHSALAEVMRGVAALRPPTEAEPAQRAFLEAANASVRLVGAAADDVDAGTLTCGSAMNDRIYGLPSTHRAERAIDELTRLGYRVLGE
jgi:hypothetical protein